MVGSLFVIWSAEALVFSVYGGGGAGDHGGEAGKERAESGKTGANDAHEDVNGRPEPGFGVFGSSASRNVAVNDANDACYNDAVWGQWVG